MHGICFDFKLQEWFDFKVPKTSVSPNFIFNAIQHETETVLKPNAKMVWLGNSPELVNHSFISKKGNKIDTWKLVIENKHQTNEILVKKEEGNWLLETIQEIALQTGKKEMTFAEFEERYKSTDLGEIERFLGSKVWGALLEYGLVLV